MLVYTGIDEAGYGPLLGPLCVASATFVIRDYDPHEGAPNMWDMLSRAVSRAGGDKNGLIAIDDSKKLKGPNNAKRHPLRKLERGVLAFLLHEFEVETDDSLYDYLGVATSSCRWYCEPNALPLANPRDELKISSSNLARHLDREGITFSGIACEAIDAPDFNEQVGRMGTKAAVNLCAALRLIDRVWKTYPEDHPRVLVDRHGGRTHYRQDLQHAWPDAHVSIIAENTTCSRYLLKRGDRALTVTFTTKAEHKHLPVALASMTAKYVRELMMRRLNRFFRQQMPDLKPTAGYYVDGKRFIEDIDPLIRKLNIDRRDLVRVR